MSSQVHPSAIIGQRVELGENVTIGPHCIVEDDVVIGDETVLHAFATVGQFTTLGKNNEIFHHACIGLPPQDLKFNGEKTVAVIGDHNVFRENATVHRGTESGGGTTSIGNHNLFMVGSHIAHDCMVGNHNIFANCGTLAGHVTVGEKSTIGAFSAVHQFCRVGDYAFIGGFSVITQDALPYVKSVGNRAKAYGINTLGLQRQQFTSQEIDDLRAAYRTLFQKKLRLVEALQTLKADYPQSEKVQYLVSFIEQSERGITR